MSGRPMTNGLHVKRTLVCPCGTAFDTKNPSARFCSNACRTRCGAFGRSYGTVAPRALGLPKS